MKELCVRLAGPIQKDSIVDGEGIRTVIWFQGCLHKCPGCHNPNTHEIDGGIQTLISDLFNEIDSLEIQDGVTLSGGDPFYQPEAMLELARYIKTKKLNVWAYTGYTFEELIELSNSKPILLDILKSIDVLVDGPFIIREKSLNILFRGSKNQRIIDVKKSLKNHKAVQLIKYKREKRVIKNKGK